MFDHLTWVHYTSATGLLGLFTTMAVSKFAPGFFDAVGEKIFVGAWEWVRPFFNPFFRPKKKKFSGYQIGGLVKTVQYLKKQDKEKTKTIQAMKKEIKSCTAERSSCTSALAEARTQITDINLWRERFQKDFEKKMKIKTAQKVS